MMLVGIDASRATPPPRTGTENYSVGLIRALLKRGRHHYRLYYRETLAAELIGYDAEYRPMPARRLWTHTRLAVEIRRSAPDALFVPAHVLPLTHPPVSVVTAHDVGFRYFPGAHPLIQRLYLGLTTHWAARRARILLADSEATRQDLIRLYGAQPQRIRVVYPAVDERFSPQALPGEAETIRQTYHLPSTYLLYVGTLQPRKNLGVLIEALNHTRSDVTLAVVGGVGWGGEAARLQSLVARLGLDSRVRFLGHAPNADLPALMRQATAVALPSLYEGFGMPLAEAMACGTPTLASNTSSLPEVVGEAGILLPPRDVAAWAAAIDHLWTSPSLREDLRGHGLSQARQFTWDRAAEATEKALEAAKLETED